jgi:sortase A
MYDAPGTSARPRRDGLRYLVEAVRTRRWARRAVSALSLVLLLGGVALLGYPFATNLYQDRVQARLDRQLASPQLEQAYRERRVQTGDSLTRIKIPKIDVDVVVVEGTSASALRAGAGHYPETPLPCDAGNVGIAGHRTTYGKPFNQIDRLRPGDLIFLDTPVGSCTYQVARDPFVVLPDDFSVVAPPYPDASARWLTLTSCHPKGSASHRIIIRAVFVKGDVTSA